MLSLGHHPTVDYRLDWSLGMSSADHPALVARIGALDRRTSVSRLRLKQEMAFCPVDTLER